MYFFLPTCCCCSVVQSCWTLCNPVDCSMPGFPVPDHLPKFAHVPVHCINDTIQPSHPLMALFSFSPQSFPPNETFPISQLFISDDQNTAASASASVLPTSIQGWFPFRLTDLISLLSKGLSGVFSTTTVQRHQFSTLRLLYGSALTTLRAHGEDHSLDYMDLCWHSNVSAFQYMSRCVIAFLPRGNCRLISWLWSPSAVILEPKKRKSVTTSTFSPSICHAVMGLDAMILAFF